MTKTIEKVISDSTCSVINDHSSCDKATIIIYTSVLLLYCPYFALCYYHVNGTWKHGDKRPSSIAQMKGSFRINVSKRIMLSKKDYPLIMVRCVAIGL